ncbi:DUF502 domain-containing protein [Isosphaeraceae bacterium EP7]
MDYETNPPTGAADGRPTPKGFFSALLGALFGTIRSRIFSGLLFIAPAVITLWIVGKVLSIFQTLVLDPLARLVLLATHVPNPEDLPRWWIDVVAPAIGLSVVLTILYFLGYFVRTWVSRWLDWFFLKIPVVTLIYNGVNNLVKTMSDPTKGYSRVVLIEFPQPGLKSLAFVTKTLRDPGTGETILAVCLLTGVMPPSGFTLFVRERDVVEVDWTVQQTIQSVLSGGMTSPDLLRFGAHDPTSLVDRA